MYIIDWEQLDLAGRAAALARPQAEAAPGVTAQTREVIEAVRKGGDEALKALTLRFDQVEVQDLKVSIAEFAEARGALTEAQIAALERAIANVRMFHRAQQLPDRISVETEPGVRCEHVVRAIEKVGLYVPAGNAPLPSTVIMLAVPAEIAGCPVRVLCTPPDREGFANPAVLVAAQLCGIDTVFKVGGAQAIAAMSYGTETIPRVSKIFGPGNAWVTAAKQQVALDPNGAACDLPAGPSEVLIIADHTARADFVAADLLAQAEHDRLAQGILVTPSVTLAYAVSAAIDRLRPALSRRAILAASVSSLRCLVVPTLEVALEIANAYAAEHLLLQVADPRRWLRDVRDVGSVFLGDWSPETLGDYCSGANHVLPTYGYARSLSGLSLRDFTRSFTVQEVSREGLRALGATAITLATLEGLDAHALAVTSRLDVLSGKAP